MRSFVPRLSVVAPTASVALLIIGCGLSGPGGSLPYPYEGEASEDDAQQTNGQGAAGPGSGVTSSSSTTSGSAGSGAAGSSASSTSASSTVSSGVTTGGGNDPLCQPDGLDPCLDCARAACCPEIQACAQDQNCICWVDCVSVGGDLISCGGQCGLPGAAIQAVFDCSSEQCPNECTL